MKILILAVLVALSFQATINTPCAVELAKLTAKLAKLYVDVHAGRIPAATADIVATFKEIQVVKEKCSPQEQAQFLNYGRDIATCVQDTYQISMATYKAYQDYENSGITTEFLEEVDQIALRIDPMIADCDSQEAADHFNVLFPPECINSVESLGVDSLQIIADQNKPAQLVKDLVALSKDYTKARKVCPFLK